MEQLTHLTAIMHSKRANIYYLEKCRILQKDGRVLYFTEDKEGHRYWNIPIANTTVILLGNGTSITQAAIRMLASAHVLIGFCGGGGTPLLMGNEIECEWMTPQSEYRPTEYVQVWLKNWFDESWRLTQAKFFQKKRIEYIKLIWSKDDDLLHEGLDIEAEMIENAIKTYQIQINQAENTTKLLVAEANLTKRFYKYMTQTIEIENFVRNAESYDLANQFLNQGNYLAYGLAATTLWVLGIPHAFAVMHGKTRRGALVFDVADLIKDAIILPNAFICAKNNATEQKFRQQLLQKFTDYKALDYLFAVVKEAAQGNDQ